MYVCMYVCMYVYIYIYIYTHDALRLVCFMYQYRVIRGKRWELTICRPSPTSAARGPSLDTRDLLKPRSSRGCVSGVPTSFERNGQLLVKEVN